MEARAAAALAAKGLENQEEEGNGGVTKVVGRRNNVSISKAQCYQIYICNSQITGKNAFVKNSLQKKLFVNPQSYKCSIY